VKYSIHYFFLAGNGLFPVYLTVKENSGMPENYTVYDGHEYEEKKRKSTS
jgi:hypothetical protein